LQTVSIAQPIQDPLHRIQRLPVLHLQPPQSLSSNVPIVYEKTPPGTRARNPNLAVRIQAGFRKNLGHATVAFTLDIYGHVTPQMKQDSADRMQRLIDSCS
jgi:hypothetical protein